MMNLPYYCWFLSQTKRQRLKLTKMHFNHFQGRAKAKVKTSLKTKLMLFEDNTIAEPYMSKVTFFFSFLSSRIMLRISIRLPECLIKLTNHYIQSFQRDSLESRKALKGGGCQTLNNIIILINFFQCRNAKCSCFASSIFGPGKNVTAGKSNGNAFFLDGGRSFKTLLIYSHEQLTFQKVILKFISFSCCNILGTINTEQQDKCYKLELKVNDDHSNNQNSFND